MEGGLLTAIVWEGVWERGSRAVALPDMSYLCPPKQDVEVGWQKHFGVEPKLDLRCS